MVLLFILAFFSAKNMLPEILNNHFDYVIPYQIFHLNVGEGNNEKFTSDSEESFHSFDI
jgi:hypothetical protein